MIIKQLKTTSTPDVLHTHKYYKERMKERSTNDVKTKINVRNGGFFFCFFSGLPWTLP